MNAERIINTQNRTLCIDNAKHFLAESKRHRAIGEQKVAVFCLDEAAMWRKKAAESLNS